MESRTEYFPLPFFLFAKDKLQIIPFCWAVDERPEFNKTLGQLYFGGI